MSWRALILAGSRGPEDPVARAAGVAHKALAPVAGRTMLEHVVAALGAREIAVSAPPDLPLPEGVRRIDAAGSPAASVQAALATLGTPLLITTADNPLLTAETLGAFLAGSEAGGADVAAGVARREVVEAAGNPARRTYLKFRDGRVSGCNLFAIRTPAGEGAVALWRRIEMHRKRPWRMAREIGIGTLARYLAGRLDSADAARALGKAAGCRAGLVPLDDPFAAHDVDKPADLAFAERVLKGRA